MFSVIHAPYFLFTSNVLLGFLVEELFDSTSCFPAKCGKCHSSGLCNCTPHYFSFYTIRRREIVLPQWTELYWHFCWDAAKTNPKRTIPEHYGGCYRTEFPHKTPQITVLIGDNWGFFLEHLLGLQAMNLQQYSMGHGTISLSCSWDSVGSTGFKWSLQVRLINCSIPLII